MIKELKKRRDVLYECVQQIPGFKCDLTDCAFYLYVNVTEAMNKLKLSNVEDFRKLILNKTGVSFCTRDHFSTPHPNETEKYIRLAFSAAKEEMIREGCNKLKEYLENPY